jgi:hypothetical protein
MKRNDNPNYFDDQKENYNYSATITSASTDFIRNKNLSFCEKAYVGVGRYDLGISSSKYNIKVS